MFRFFDRKIEKMMVDHSERRMEFTFTTTMDAGVCILIIFYLSITELDTSCSSRYRLRIIIMMRTQ